MKKFIIASLFLLVGLSDVFASQVIPVYPDSVCDQKVCVSLSKGREFDFVIVSTFLISPLAYDFTAHLLVNGVHIAREKIAVRDRSNIPTTNLTVGKELQGAIEIYFVDSKGNYISNYGNNFHFSLE